jgi:hypothetical protein
VFISEELRPNFAQVFILLRLRGKTAKGSRDTRFRESWNLQREEKSERAKRGTAKMPRFCSRCKAPEMSPIASVHA